MSLSLSPYMYIYIYIYIYISRFTGATQLDHTPSNHIWQIEIGSITHLLNTHTHKTELIHWNFIPSFIKFIKSYFWGWGSLRVAPILSAPRGSGCCARTCCPCGRRASSAARASSRCSPCSSVEAHRELWYYSYHYDYYISVSLSLYACTYIHIYIYMCIYIYIYIILIIYIYIYTHIRIYMFIPIPIPLPPTIIQTSYCTHLLSKHVIQIGLGMVMGMNSTAHIIWPVYSIRI